MWPFQPIFWTAFFCLLIQGVRGHCRMPDKPEEERHAIKPLTVDDRYTHSVKRLSEVDVLYWFDPDKGWSPGCRTWFLTGPGAKGELLSLAPQHYLTLGERGAWQLQKTRLSATMLAHFSGTGSSDSTVAIPFCFVLDLRGHQHICKIDLLKRGAQRI